MITINGREYDAAAVANMPAAVVRSVYRLDAAQAVEVQAACERAVNKTQAPHLRAEIAAMQAILADPTASEDQKWAATNLIRARERDLAELED